MVVAGNNPEIPLLSWITLRFTIKRRSAYQEFAIVSHLTIDILIGGMFLRPHECQIIYKAPGPYEFGIKDGCWEKCALNKEKMIANHDPQLQATPKRTASKGRNLSCMAVTTRFPDEQERRREKFCKVISELKIDLISVSDAMKHHLVSVLAQ